MFAATVMSNRTLLHSLLAFFIIIIVLVATVQLSPISWSTRLNASSSKSSSSSSKSRINTTQLQRPSPGLSAIFEGHDSLSALQYLDYVATPLIKVNDHEYSSFGGLDFDLPETDPPQTPTQPLGEQLCIIDLDNRPFNQSGMIWADTPMSWERPREVHGLSMGVLNHWLYAKIHGYKYYFVHIDEFEDRRASWKKASIIPKVLTKHETCIYLDSDAIFTHLGLPFEWLMDYWQLDGDSNSLALAYDPDLPFNKDKFDETYVNTGFIIAQNNPKTFEIMEAWNACPDEGGDHPDCTEFRKADPGRPTDQGGFGTFIRYDYPDDIKSLPCKEANGFPESDTECNGDFIEHLWYEKDRGMKMTVGRQMPGDLLEMFHSYFLKEKAKFWQTEQMLFSTGQELGGETAA